MALSHRDCFLQSLNRCSQNEQFIPAFYDRFLSTSEDIRDRFKDTDFEKQNQMLLRSLKLAAGATAGDQESLREIHERAVTHDRHHLNIEPRLYDAWLHSVIAAASEFDEQWDALVEESWDTILGYVVKHMIRYY
jgi:hemoglobin-like flavoprotein